MRNIKLTIEYDGTNYSGWQVQNKQFRVRSWEFGVSRSHHETIQKILEKALSKILQEKVKVIASGRTDAGVHARGQTANFKTKSKIAGKNIQRALNSILPQDIRISEAEEVPLDFHARFWAQSKLYRYSIINDSFVSPHLRRYAHLVKFPLDVQKMQQAAKNFLGRHNFRSFQSQDKQERDARRRIRRLEIKKKGNLLTLDIEADGFLYRMVRNIVGTLIEVGRGRLKPEQVKPILEAKNRIYAGPCAPAKGLCLTEVKYKN